MPLISPNHAMKNAQDLMLDGREPETDEDWAKIVNCLAVNLSPEIAESAILLMKRIYDIPLVDDQIKEIVAYQLARIGH